MKIRNGFVSNSSSSSFIIGLGEVKNKQQFLDWVRTLKVGRYQYLGIDILDETMFSDGAIECYLPCSAYDCREEKDIVENVMCHHSINTCDGNFIMVQAPNNDGAVLRRYYDAPTEYFRVRIGNGEGTAAFWDESKDACDYNITENFFTGYQAEILRMLKEEIDVGVDVLGFLFGAAMNG